MRFYTLEVNGREVPAVSIDGGKKAYILDYRDMNELICTITPEKLKSLPDDLEGKECVELDGAKILAPIVRPRQDVVCLGINYTDHAEEAGKFSNDAFGGERPYTIYFSKRVSYAPGTGAGIPSYQGYVDSLDYESELGVVLGKDVKNISREEAESAIFGYTVINDVSARNIQTRHKQWYLGKSLDGHTPMGPCIVTPDEIGDATNLGIRSYVNGELRQSSNTGLMIQTVAGAITELCHGMTLQAGTIIATGTPAGVGMGFTPPKFLKVGDTVVCEIENIGRLENVIV